MILATLLSIFLTTEAEPLDFRCDSLQVDSKAGQSVCSGNVVIIRGPVLMCCDQFEAQANADWQWKSFRCQGNVKAQRLSERVWSDESTFDLDDSLITLLGSPILKRGRSLMTGDRVSIDLKTDQAKVSNPRGRVSKNATATKPYPSITKLEDTCPLPEKPKF